jgi:hypothetical protein
MMKTNLNKFKHPNKHIPHGFVTDLLEYYKYIRLDDLVRQMGNLNCSDFTAWLDNGAQVTVLDLMGMYGDSEFAQDVDIWFYGGPEKIYDTGLTGAMDHKFQCIGGSALEWFVDTILTNVCEKGLDPLRDIQYAGMGGAPW